MQNKPLILITNDDGYQAKGINSLIEFLIGLGEIVVVAPDGARSGMSGAITSTQPIRYSLQHKDEHKSLTIYSCTGTPVDCVKLGISEILKREPDVVVSGINHGTNSSICVHYSGTMGAAIEGCIFNIPSIGYSLLNHRADADFSGAKDLIRKLTQDVITKGLPQGVCLNVNIPKGEVKGAKVCRQTTGKWIEEFVRSKDGVNKDVFWLTGKFENAEPLAEDTDEWALANDYASIVPIKTDITAYELLTKMQEWNNLI